MNIGDYKEMKYFVINECLISMEEVLLMRYDKETSILRVVFKNGVAQNIEKVNDDIYLQIKRILNKED